MKVLMKIISNKYLLWCLIAASIFAIFQVRSCQIDAANKRLETYKRQLQGQLSKKERELQKANKDLGLMQSELLTQHELANRLRSEMEEISDNFNNFIKKHNLQIKSKDKTIAELKQKIENGSSEVIITPTDGGTCDGIEDKCVIAYAWTDDLGRFKLTDPNVFEKNNETFEAKQVFKVYGEIWQQKDGSLQTKRLVLREVHLGENGKYEEIPDAKANIIDSKFEYHNPPPDPNLIGDWRDLFKLRAIAIASITAWPDYGRLRLGIGLEFFNFHGFGINTHIGLDFTDAYKIEHRLGIAYELDFFGPDLNIAIGASVGTPYAKFFNEISVNIGFIFYINN